MQHISSSWEVDYNICILYSFIQFIFAHNIQYSCPGSHILLLHSFSYILDFIPTRKSIRSFHLPMFVTGIRKVQQHIIGRTCHKFVPGIRGTFSLHLCTNFLLSTTQRYSQCSRILICRTSGKRRKGRSRFLFYIPYLTGAYLYPLRTVIRNFPEVFFSHPELRSKSSFPC